MRARSGPPWSSTITSWIMVSSRCVLGSSTGIREFSARERTKSPIAARTSAGAARPHASGSAGPSMPPSESEPVARARTRRQRKRAGSARLANVTSRAAPIPSNGEPVSSAASAVAKRARPRRYAKRTKSPLKERTAGAPGAGRRGGRCGESWEGPPCEPPGEGGDERREHEEHLELDPAGRDEPRACREPAVG